MNPLDPIPLVVLTGFLGAGKTTALNRWLAHPVNAGTLVIVNEYGEVGLDHLLVENAPGDVVLLAAGCLCCSLRGDLVMTLEDLLCRRDNRRIAFFRQVVVETTGLADPLPILHAILQHPYLSKRFEIRSITTLVDATRGAATIDRHAEARRQLALADRLLVTKTDLAESDGLASVIAPFSPVLPEPVGGFDPAALFSPLFSPTPDTLARWMTETGGSVAAHGIESFTFAADRALDAARVTGFQEAMRLVHGAKILRMKGLLRLSDEAERPGVIQQVQSVASPLARLPRWPSRDRRSRLVFITDGLPRDALEPFWNALIA